MKESALNREQIKKADDIEKKKVECPEWGGPVWIRGLTGKQRDKWESEFIESSSGMIEAELEDGKKQRMNPENARARLVVKCAVDEQGNRIFEDSDVEWLGEKSAKALDRCYEKARELSGISEDDIEEAEKALGNGQRESSGSS